MNRIRAVATLAALVVATLLAASCSGGSAGPRAGSGGGAAASAPAIKVLSILPPGSSSGPSQRRMYDALTTVAPPTLTDADLTRYYKPAPLDPAPADVVSRSTPRPGVTILRDTFGVPYIYGKTDADTAYGAGYAGTQDRMFVMDALRYAGSGRRSELLGATPANLAADAEQLRQADYTPAEAIAQINAVAKASPAGADLGRRLTAFVEGVNAARKAMCPTAAASTCPAPYRLLHLTPTPFTSADVVYAASLVGGIFGKGGGSEAANARFLRQLQAKLGDVEGQAAFKDLADPLDPTTPVTDPDPDPYGQPGTVARAAVARLDLKTKIAAGTAGVPASALPNGAGGATADPGGGAGGGSGQTVALGIDTGLDETASMSNALLVAGSHTTDGRPIAVFGPQTGYQSPSFWDEMSLHGPHYDARGVAFANLQFVILIGHGRSYAWSATSASGDVVDTVLDRLCNTDGRPATVNSMGYLDGARCVPMATRRIVERADGGSGRPIATMTDYRTRHGIVAYRTTADRVPVAVVSERSTYGHEPDSVLGFAMMNDPAAIHGPADFLRAFSEVDFTFNWFYVDNRDIATFTSGLLPIRAAGVDPEMPRWGDAKWDWKGFLPADKHPQTVDPPDGYLVNWNNKPSSGTYSADDEWGWGPVQRVLALRDRLRAAVAKGKVSRAQVVAAMTDASTVDVRGAYLLPVILAVVGDDPALARYTTLLRAWIASGAHRVDPSRTGHYTDSPAIALFDDWFPRVERAVLSGRLGSLAAELPAAVDNTPSGHSGSAFDNIAGYSYVYKDLHAVLGDEMAGAYARKYCGAGSLAACRTALRASLTAAVASVSAAQKTSDPSRWGYQTSRDEIQFMYLGASVPAIAWQNRPTFQQVVGSG
ncbi:MAG: penicillin acylase family protein [Frankia sp.]